jgi:hypothetical protein
MALEYSIYDGLVTAFAVMLLGVSLGIPALAVLSELSGIIRGKVFMDKFARQSARLGLAFIYAVLLGAAGALGICLYFPDSTGAWVQYDLFWGFGLYLSLLAAVLFSLYYFLWDRLKKYKPLHIFLGALGVVSIKAFLAVLFWSLYRELMVIPQVMPGPDSIFLPILAQVFLISLSGAAALTLVYLLIIRTRDDFGRDYYRFALGFGAKWGIFFAAVSPVTCAWLFLVMENGIDPAYIAVPGGVYLLALMALILVLRRISRSDQPLRNKAATWLCPVLIWVILVFRLVSYLEFANMISEETVIHTFVRDWPVLF